jgi:hypothetical protein
MKAPGPAISRHAHATSAFLAACWSPYECWIQRGSVLVENGSYAGSKTSAPFLKRTLLPE